MTYELAKQLKDAGFPLNECNLEECYWDGGSFTDGVVGNEHTYHFPTLSELISACGKDFRHLIQVPEVGEQKHEWEALASFSYLGSVGASPEEAVAKLWLELNKK